MPLPLFSVRSLWRAISDIKLCLLNLRLLELYISSVKSLSGKPVVDEVLKHLIFSVRQASGAVDILLYGTSLQLLRIGS